MNGTRPGRTALAVSLGCLAAWGCRSAPWSAEDMYRLRENSLNVLKMSCSTHGSSEVRAAAARALGLIQVDEALPWLQQGLYDAVPVVRMESCLALSALSSADMTTPFARLLEDSDVAVRAAGLTAMVERGHQEHRAALTGLLGGAPELRTAAAEVAVSRGAALMPTAVVRAWLDGAGSDEHAYRRALLAVLLSRSDPDALAALQRDLTGPAGCQPQAIELAASAVDAAVVSALLVCLQSDLDLPIRLAAARSLGRFEFFEGLKLAREALDHEADEAGPDPGGEIRALACRICGESGSMEVLGPLSVRLAVEQDPMVRVTCAAAVLRLITSRRGESGR